MITFQKEAFANIIHELPELFAPHHADVALKHKKLNPGWTEHLKLESIGVLHIMTMRDDGKLVGYFFAILCPDINDTACIMSQSDKFWIRPEYRGNGFAYVRLLRAADGMLEALGVHESYLMTRANRDVKMLMKRLKYKLTEKRYIKVFKRT